MAWALCVALALLFGVAGLGKVSAQPEVVARFAAWNYSDPFRIFIGFCELTGAIGLLVPKLSVSASAGLGGILLGALGTHWAHGESILLPSLTLALIVLTGWLRWDEAFFTWTPRRPHR